MLPGQQEHWTHWCYVPGQQEHWTCWCYLASRSTGPTGATWPAGALDPLVLPGQQEHWTHWCYLASRSTGPTGATWPAGALDPLVLPGQQEHWTHWCYLASRSTGPTGATQCSCWGFPQATSLDQHAHQSTSATHSPSSMAMPLACQGPGTAPVGPVLLLARIHWCYLAAGALDPLVIPGQASRNTRPTGANWPAGALDPLVLPGQQEHCTHWCYLIPEPLLAVSFEICYELLMGLC